VAFGLLFVALSDPGGEYLPRLRRKAVVGLIGALLTALGFGIGAGAWGWVVLAVFVVTAVSGLVINVDLYALVAGILLNVWFLMTLSDAAGLPTGVSAHPWNQALAWLIGAAIAIALMSAMWLAGGEVAAAVAAARDPCGPSAGQTKPADSPVRSDPGRRRLGRHRHRLRAAGNQR
jgi:hypothetical protein